MQFSMRTIWKSFRTDSIVNSALDKIRSVIVKADSFFIFKSINFICVNICYVEMFNFEKIPPWSHFFKFSIFSRITFYISTQVEGQNWFQAMWIKLYLKTIPLLQSFFLQ